jgi:hypothetical protein
VRGNPEKQPGALMIILPFLLCPSSKPLIQSPGSSFLFLFAVDPDLGARSELHKDEPQII